MTVSSHQGEEYQNRIPYPLIIPQNVTELVLGQKLQSLGIRVQRPHRVVGMKESENDPRIVDVTFEDGQVIRARYVIGADGARSLVRSHCRNWVL